MKSIVHNGLSAWTISREMGVVAAFKCASVCAVACTRYSTTHYTYTRTMAMGGSSGPGM